MTHESDGHAASCRRNHHHVQRCAGPKPEPAGHRLSPISRFRQQKVKLTDQFGASQAVVVREQFLCAPVEKNGESMKNKENHLVCYGVTGGKDARKRVEVANQFGKATLQLGGTVLLCVPSLKKVLN